MSECNSALQQAQKNTAAGTNQVSRQLFLPHHILSFADNSALSILLFQAQASCQQAKFDCGQFYSSAQVNSHIPACAKYNSAINN